MKAFAEAVRSGAIKGATGKPFKAILHIGIGGSDLGPRLLWDALRPLKPQSTCASWPMSTAPSSC
jgi:glucose-6-phosphate isomerase